MTRGERLLLSFAAVLLWVYGRSLRRPLELPALLLPAAVHELCHVISLLLGGCRVRSIRPEAMGLCIRYQAPASEGVQLASALAGPFGGLVYALALWRAEAPWLRLSAEWSLLLSLYNLLPILPLDGGRAFLHLARLRWGEERAQAWSRGLGLLFLIPLLGGGLFCLCRGLGSAPLIAGLWLLSAQLELAKESAK